MLKIIALKNDIPKIFKDNLVTTERIMKYQERRNYWQNWN